MTIGALGFMSPWLLLGLAALPAIWWLLRAVPPQPNRVHFPATRLLKDLKAKDQETAKSPWWLTLIRMLAAALVIFALADPILNPKTDSITGSGPITMIVDNGWGAAGTWDDRMESASTLLDQAERVGRSVTIIPTATSKTQSSPAPETAKKARDRLAAIAPQPFAPDRLAALATLGKSAPDETSSASGAMNIVWLSDSLDYGNAAKFKDALAQRITGKRTLRIIQSNPAKSPVAVRRVPSSDGKLKVAVLRAEGTAMGATLVALNKRGQQLAATKINLASGELSKEATFDLPLELRNQITRIALSSEKSAAAIHLLDASSQWNRIGLVSGVSQEKAQPLLAPLYYIGKALRPFGDIVRVKDASVAAALPKLLEQKTSTIFVADIGTITGSPAKTLEKFMANGGVLVRFAGPRLEKSNDALLPAPLRFGGRTLGGALSWSSPQALSPFDEDSVFAGLRVTPEVTVNRQVLADPARLPADLKVWARLSDGTPLVTAQKRGKGWLVLFHITANSDWSNLPLSGLFVEMLRRLTTLAQYDPTAADTGNSSGTPKAGDDDAKSQADDLTSTEQNKVYPPVQVISGFGELIPPTATATPASARVLRTGKPSSDHPPGFYGAADSPIAFNLINGKTRLKPLGALPSTAEVSNYASGAETRFKPWLLFAALGLLFADILATMFLRSGSYSSRRAPAAAAVLLAAAFVFLASPTTGYAQGSSTGANAASSKPPTAKLSPAEKAQQNAFAVEAVSQTRFAFVLTGDAELDRVSEAGLRGLSRMIAARTAVEPEGPVGVNIDRDELAFFPILYWPVPTDAQPLPEKTRSRVETYMKRGGMIIFDTRDANTQIPGLSNRGGNQTPIQRLLQDLDLPTLEPVPTKHVLTRSFYLLSAFPGRWANGEMWVEAQSKALVPGQRQASKADGVTTIIITANDLAGAWALDESNRPLFTVVPGGELQREMAFRVGVNIVMYALTGNYKADQVHIPALLERLGQ